MLAGGDEPPPARSQRELLASRIPDARLVGIPDAGHFAPLEQPEAFASAVAGFLRELPR